MSKKTKKSAFDFRTINSFEAACAKENIDPLHMPDVSGIPEEFRKAIIGVYKLMVIFKAINNGWRPDWNDYNQLKYFPWFRVLSSGFGFSGSAYGYDVTFAYSSSRLCTYGSEQALFIAETFGAEYGDFFLYSE